MSAKILQALRSNRSLTNIRHEALMGLMLVGNQQIARQQKFFKQYGITTQQFNVLRILRGQNPEPCPQFLIKERMMDKMSDVSRLVNRLYKSGLVSRAITKTDKRTQDIKITDKGLTLLKLLDQEIHVLWTLSDLSDAEVETLIALLEKILGDTAV